MRLGQPQVGLLSGPFSLSLLNDDAEPKIVFTLLSFHLPLPSCSPVCLFLLPCSPYFLLSAEEVHKTAIVCLPGTAAGLGAGQSK